MIVKAVLVFLLVMLAIGMVGNVLFPGALSKAAKKRLPLGKSLPLAKTPTCPRCGKYQIGTSVCGCEGK